MRILYKNLSAFYSHFDCNYLNIHNFFNESYRENKTYCIPDTLPPIIRAVFKVIMHIQLFPPAKIEAYTCSESDFTTIKPKLGYQDTINHFTHPELPLNRRTTALNLQRDLV